MRQHRRANVPALLREPATPAVVCHTTRLDGPLPPLGDELMIVSGLPRSGTSMLMQMLIAGGMTILSDNKRESDQDNPRGYFELEAVKTMFREQGWLADARGKVIKVVVPIVSGLPPGHDYRVILIERDYDEILASQATMIERRGESMDENPERRDRLRREYARQVAAGQKPAEHAVGRKDRLRPPRRRDPQP